MMEQDSAPVEAKELVGFEVKDAKLDFEGDSVVASAKASHVGKIGWLNITVEGGVSAKPFIFKAIDFIEKKIPGDQTSFAAIAKAAVDKAFS